MEYPFKDLMPLDEATARDGYYKDWTHIDADTFHQISELAKFIREKGRGADTREAIAQALERVYHDAAISGNANMEVSQAKGSYSTLSERLNETDNKQRQTDEQLAQKANQSDVRLREVKLGQNDMTDTFLQKIAGNTPVNATPNKGSITKDRLSQKLISQEQTNFLLKGKNLYNKDDVILGYALSTSSGELFSSASYLATDFIGVKANTTYYRNRPSNVVFYDSTFTRISGISESSGSFTTPANAVYVRLSMGVGYRGTMQIEEGTQGTEIENFHLLFDWLRLKEGNFQKGIVPVNSLKDLVLGKNLFNKNDIVIGSVNVSTGIVDSGLPGYTSGYIEIEPNTDYSKNIGANFAFYDANKTFISGTFNSAMATFVSPSNAKYIRISVNDSNLDKLQLEKGVELTEYQPFGYYISDLLYEYEINELRKDLNALSTGGVSKEVKYPTPALVEPDISLIGGTSRSVAFVDKDNNLWAIQWDNKIYKNPVNTSRWEMVIDTKPFLESGETISGYALVVSDTGRMVVGTNKGRVLVSDTAQTTLEEAFTFKGGYTQATWGFDKQGQYILMGSYLVSKNAENPGREVYLSKDHGETWELIFDKPIGEMVKPSDYHIHDVAFDPYSKAILVVQGDTVNNQIYYSYDFGNTWKEVNPNGTSKVHPTSILCFPEGIAFGSDELPEGISWWDRPTDETEPDIKQDDIYWKKKFNLGESIIGNIAVKGATLFDESGLYGVIGFMNHNTSAPGYPRLFATGDGGRSWHQIWKSDNQIDENGFFNTLLRKTDSGIEIYSRYSVGGQPHLFKANMPTFITP